MLLHERDSLSDGKGHSLDGDGEAGEIQELVKNREIFPSLKAPVSILQPPLHRVVPSAAVLAIKKGNNPSENVEQ